MLITCVNNNSYYLLKKHNCYFQPPEMSKLPYNSVSKLINGYKSVDLTIHKSSYFPYSSNEVIIIEIKTKEELLNLSKTHPELFI